MYCNDAGAMMTIPMQPAYNNGFGGNGMEWMMMMWLWPLFLYGGFGGGFGSGAGGGFQGAEIQRGFDNQSVMNKLNGLENGLCDGFYAQNTNTLNGFHGVDTAVAGLGSTVQGGFNATQMAMMQAQNALAAELADCCCKTQTAIQANTTQGVMNTNAVQQQIQQCCCENEKQAMQTRFDAQQYNCNTLQAIDKLGDRIIGHLTHDKMQDLRDENRELRLAASQQAQNAFIAANNQAQTAELLRRIGGTTAAAA